MEGPIILLLLITLALLFVLPPLALVKAQRAQREIEKLNERLRALEMGRSSGSTEVPAVPRTVSVNEKTAAAAVGEAVSFPSPPPIPRQEARPIPQPINWEQFMGAKMFAWIGGLALFLGVGFFVKYSFEHNLVPPEVRVAIGFVVGLALLIGGLLLKRKENVVTAQTLCATGILILYAVTFACRAFYHFSFFGLVPTFALMTLITVAAFLLAVRMNALVVAVLGIAGGFLTPILLSTGQDNPLALFGYIALVSRLLPKAA